MDEWLLKNLICPRDQKELAFGHDHLECPNGHVYHVISGIPIMIFEDERPTHDYLRRSLEQVKRVVSGETLESVLRPVETANGIDGFVQGELPYTNGNLYFCVQNKLTRYPLPFLRLPESKGERLLDVGCNWGRWSIRAAQKGYKPVGIDPSLDAVLAAQRVSKQLGVETTFVVGDARYLPFRDGCFDVGFSYGVLQHFSKENARAALAEIDRTLKENGRVLVQMPNKYGLRSLQQQWRRGFSEGKDFDVRYWTPSELLSTFEKRFGKTVFTADCYFGLGIQASDVDLLPTRFKTVVHTSELLRKISGGITPLAKLADSVYLESVKRPPRNSKNNTE